MVAKDTVKHMLGLPGMVKWGTSPAIFWGTNVNLVQTIITKKVLSAIHYPYKEVSLETIKPWKTMKALSNVKKESLQIKMTPRQFFSIITA